MQFAVNEWVLGSSPRGDANGVLVELVQCRLVTAKVTGSSPVHSADRVCRLEHSFMSTRIQNPIDVNGLLG